jgi:hypothetical protein
VYKWHIRKYLSLLVAYNNLHSSYRRFTGTSPYLRYTACKSANVQHKQTIRKWPVIWVVSNNGTANSWPPAGVDIRQVMKLIIFLHKFVTNSYTGYTEVHSCKYACNETNLMHYLSSVYSVTTLLHVSGLLVAHHQEVAMYICVNWYMYVLIDCRWTWAGPLTVN